MGRLDGKIACVTGAGAGIGQAIATRLAEEGAAVALTDINEPAVQAAAEALKEKGYRAIAIRHDAGDEASWAAVLDAAGETLGPLDILVNNAYRSPEIGFGRMKLDDWKATQDVTLAGTFLGVQAAIRRMSARGGAIVNISSTAGVRASSDAVAYSAAKAGVAALTRSAMLWCAERNIPVRINAVAPGTTRTAGFMRTVGIIANAKTEAEVEAAVKTVGAALPMKRVAEPREIANAVLFLVSDEASYVNGHELVVDGGVTWTARGGSLGKELGRT